MKSFTFVSFLALATVACVSAATQLELALQFVECSRLAIYYGIPEVQLPCHMPLRVRRSFNYTVPLGDQNINIHLSNLTIDKLGIVDVKDAADISTTDEIATFNYTLWWPHIVFGMNVAISLDDVTLLDGTFSADFVGAWFRGVWGQGKPWQELTELDQMTAKVTVDDFVITTTNMGALGTLLESASDAAGNFVNNYNDIGAFIKNKVKVNFLQKKYRIRGIANRCGMKIE